LSKAGTFQLFQIHRLDEIVCSAQAHRLHRLRDVAIGGEHHHRHPGGEFGQGQEIGRVRQLHVQQHQVGLQDRQALAGAGPGVGAAHRMAGLGELAGQQAVEHRVVFDHEHSALGVGGLLWGHGGGAGGCAGWGSGELPDGVSAADSALRRRSVNVVP
jgi:hypothetical protein